jgi:hypothetical protein
MSNRYLSLYLLAALLFSAAVLAQSYPRWGGALTGIADYQGNQFGSANPFPVQGSITTVPGIATPQAYAGLATATIGTASSPLYTFGTPAKQLLVSNPATNTGTLWLGVRLGTAGGNCAAAVVGTGTPVPPGSYFLFGPVVPLPTCAVTAVSTAAGTIVPEDGF